MLYILLTVLAGICWGCISLFLRPLSLAGFSSLQLVFLRAVISAVLMFVFLFFKNRQLLKIHLKDLWMFIGTGIVSLTFFSICYFKTILEVGTSIAVVLLYTSPIFVLVMSMILFKEKMNLRKSIALFMTFVGCVFVAGIFGGGEQQLSVKGFFIGLCAGFGYGLYSIFSRYALKKYDSITVSFYTFVFSGISLFPFIHLEKIPRIMNSKVLILLLGISIFCTVLPYIFYTIGLSGLDTGKAAIMVTVEPLVGTIIGFCVWHETISFLKITGIILIFLSVILLGLPENTENRPPSSLKS